MKSGPKSQLGVSIHWNSKIPLIYFRNAQLLYEFLICSFLFQALLLSNISQNTIQTGTDYCNIFSLSLIGSFWKWEILQINLHHYKHDEVHVYCTDIKERKLQTSPNHKKKGKK